MKMNRENDHKSEYKQIDNDSNEFSSPKLHTQYT